MNIKDFFTIDKVAEIAAEKYMNGVNDFTLESEESECTIKITTGYNSFDLKAFDEEGDKCGDVAEFEDEVKRVFF